MNETLRRRLKQDFSERNIKSFIRENVASKKAIIAKEIDILICKMMAPGLRKSASNFGKAELISPRTEEGAPTQGKLDFNQFLKVLEYVAIRTYPEVDEEVAV